MAPSFILKMAWRDSRTSRMRLLLFSLSITVGVAALGIFLFGPYGTCAQRLAALPFAA